MFTVPGIFMYSAAARPQSPAVTAPEMIFAFLDSAWKTLKSVYTDNAISARHHMLNPILRPPVTELAV